MTLCISACVGLLGMCVRTYVGTCGMICTNIILCVFSSCSTKPLIFCTTYVFGAVIALIYTYIYSETSLIQHSMGPENNVGLGGCRIKEGLLPYFNMVTVPH